MSARRAHDADSDDGRALRGGHLVVATLDAARRNAERHGMGAGTSAGSPADDVPHPSLPPVGAVSETIFVVTDGDTAVALGHPDPSMTVLASPRIGLWFELATTPLMPPVGRGPAHVGVGLVVHHLGRATIGQTVRVAVEVLAAEGRQVRFACDAHVDDRIVATGVHHRVVLGP